MFLKISKGKRQNYAYLVEGYRDADGKVKHNTLCSLGAVDKLDGKFIQSFTQLTKHVPDTEILDLNSATVTGQTNWGAGALVNYFWQQFKLDKFIAKLKRGSKLKIDIDAVLKLLLAGRLLCPQSKLQTYRNQAYYGGSKEIDLHVMYRTLDFLADHHELLQKHLYQEQLNQEKISVDVVFYDVTTFYFESVKQDDLKDFGFSKDCKVNQTQVMFSILVNDEGRPLSYEVHKGNSYEGHTLVGMLDKIKQEYGIKKVILVADRGINNGENLSKIKEAGYDYILGCRIKNAANSIKEEILNLSSYETMLCNDNGQVSFAYKILPQEKKVKTTQGKKSLSGRLIATWSGKRAAKDKADRVRMIERANDMLKNNSFTSTRGARKYLDVSLKETPTLREDKILEDAKWDGFYAIETSDMNLSSQEITKAYHQLWVVEESFRIFKHHFETRPMFHWTPKRIIGHLALSYLAFLFERSIELSLKQHKIDNASHERIREALGTMEMSMLTNGGKKMQICSEYNKLAANILLIFNLTKPMNSKI